MVDYPLLWRPRAIRSQRGLTLVELMVSLAIGLLIIAAVSMLFVGSSRSRREVELSADVIESGRYAIDVLTRELMQTGFYGALDAPKLKEIRDSPEDPPLPDICDRSVANLTKWEDSLPFYVKGLGSANKTNVDADPSCIARKPGTDAFFVQRASTCTIGAGCEAENNDNAYLQVSECGDEYTVTPIVVAQGGDAAAFVLQTKACDGTKTAKRRLIRRIYYISMANALSYQDVTLTGDLPDPVVLAENVEQMQAEYAVDTDDDGTPNTFSASPADWSQVIGVRLWLLVSSDSKSQNTKNAATYVLGGDTTIEVTADSAGNLKRRVYSTYIPFVTPKSRRES